MDANNFQYIKLTEAERILFQKPYQNCSLHQARRIDFIYIDKVDQRYLRCASCVAEQDNLEQNKLIPLIDILECNDQTIFKNWPFTNAPITKEFKNDLESIVCNESSINIRIKEIETYCQNFKDQVIQKIQNVEKDMKMKINKMSDLSNDVKNIYNTLSAKDELKKIVMNIEETQEQKNLTLKKFFDDKLSKAKNCREKLQSEINKIKIKQDNLQSQKPISVQEVILKQIDSINYFKNNEPEKQDNNQTQSKPPNSSNAQFILKLVSNKFNNCPKDFLDSFKQLLWKLSPQFEEIKINEEWKKVICNQDYNKLRDEQFNTIRKITEKFLNYESMRSSSVRSKSRLDISQISQISHANSSSLIQSENLKVIIDQISNKFNYCSQEFLDAICVEFHDIPEYFSILNLPSVTSDQGYVNRNSMLDLTDNEQLFQEVSYIIKLLTKNSSNSNSNSITVINNSQQSTSQLQQSLEQLLNNQNQGFIQDPFLTQFKEMLKQIPSILTSLFYQNPIKPPYQQVKNINSSGLTEKQTENIKKLVQKMILKNESQLNNQNENYKISISEKNQLISKMLGCYNAGQDKLIENVLERYPIFDIEEGLQSMYFSRVQMEMEYRFRNKGISIIRNKHGYQTIQVEKQSYNSIVQSSQPLIQSNNYIIRLKCQQAIEKRYIEFGVEEKYRLESHQEKEELDICIIPLLNRDSTQIKLKGELPLYKFIEDADQIEIRINFQTNVIYLTDYPTYQHIYYVKNKQLGVPNRDFRFAIKFGNQVDNFKINILQCFCVDKYQVDYFDGEK